MRIRFVVLAGLLALCCTVVTPAHAAANRAFIQRWDSAAELSSGSHDGVTVSGGALRLSNPTKTLTYADPWNGNKPTTWTYGKWTSPWSTARFSSSLTHMVPSWTATSIPYGTWMQISVRVRKGSNVGGWDTVARWGITGGIKRASSTTQSDDLASVNVDTIRANAGKTFDRWQVEVRLVRRPSYRTTTPAVTSVSGVSSTYATRSIATSTTSMTSTKVLDVPAHSQMIHRAHHREWDGGGAAWCSPTSMAMLVRSWGTGPKPSHYAGEGTDGFVDHAARYTYDYRYGGTGNWAFTTAYAGRYGLDAFVTRLYSLREAEQFIKAGIPIAASVAFSRGGLTGAPLSSTPGHLMVVVGFTHDGKVVVNDPAAPDNSSVRRTYDRAQFEKAWLNGSGGIVYVVRPKSKRLPAAAARW